MRLAVVRGGFGEWYKQHIPTLNTFWRMHFCERDLTIWNVLFVPLLHLLLHNPHKLMEYSKEQDG